MYISWGEVLKHLVTNIDIGILLQQQLNYAKMTSEGSTKECCIPILHKKITRYAYMHIVEGKDKLIVHKEQEKEKQVQMLVLGGYMHNVISYRYTIPYPAG